MRHVRGRRQAPHPNKGIRDGEGSLDLASKVELLTSVFIPQVLLLLFPMCNTLLLLLHLLFSCLEDGLASLSYWGLRDGDDGPFL